MFDLLSANTARQRMRELGRFIEFWYGPHSSVYECQDLPPDVPRALKLFYHRNAYRPPLRSDICTDIDYFYEGDGGHHLFQPKNLRREKARLKFFMEYQGEFDGFIDREVDDSPVFLKGYLPHGTVSPPEEAYGYPTKGEGTLAQSLSHFLVTHVLLTTIYEDYNNARRVYHDESLISSFRNGRTRKQLIWDAGDWTQAHCPNYVGRVYLFRESILVHCKGEDTVFAAQHVSDNGKFPR